MNIDTVLDAIGDRKHGMHRPRSTGRLKAAVIVSHHVKGALAPVKASRRLNRFVGTSVVRSLFESGICQKERTSLALTMPVPQSHAVGSLEIRNYWCDSFTRDIVAIYIASKLWISSSEFLCQDNEKLRYRYA